jgi:GTP-binding protein EngB required for normal cell division
MIAFFHSHIVKLELKRKSIHKYCNHFYFSSSPDVAENLLDGKNKQFKNITPDNKLLNHLDNLHLGFLSKRKVRIAIARKHESNGKIFKANENKKIGFNYKETPYPFRKRATCIHIAKTVNDIKNKVFLGNPPEIGIIGRSNVGKSTLLNELLGFDSSFKQKASVSEKPGHTKHLQFFALGRKHEQTVNDDVNNNNTDKLSFIEESHSSSIDKKKNKVNLQENLKAPSSSLNSSLAAALLIVDMPGKLWAYTSMNSLNILTLTLKI